jgi:uncharacterized protein YndB with AHSA1/START domain
MTTNKAQKRAIRTRMTKTGERYAAARRTLLDRDRHHQPEPDGADPAPEPAAEAAVAEPETAAESAPPLPEPAAPPAGIDLGLSEAALRRATGKGWAEWLAALDAWDAATKGHPAIARHLQEAHGLDGWWAQGVTVGYERARGLRARHQKADGFAAGVSRTFPVPAERLLACFTDEALRDEWLEPDTLSIRTVVPGRSARFDVAGGGRLAVFLTAKGPAKTAASLQHEKLADAAAVETWRAFWQERLGRLASVIAE